MTRSDRNALIAAAVILVGTVFAAYFLPSVMMSAVEVSPFAAIIVAAVFLFGFFAIFWLRSRRRNGEEE